MKIKNFITNEIYIPVFLVIITVFLYWVLYRIYIPRVMAFGCFDDCFNITAGYFISKGKVLYSDIPFNHQMLMAYLSYFIQLILKPENIYELILRHRQVLFMFSFLMSTLLVIRFKLPGLLFMIFYESSKFYLFGDRFLAEAFIVYPLVYMAGFVWYKSQNKQVFPFEYILVGIFSWFVIFMREPYVIVAIFYYVIALLGSKDSKSKKISLIIFLILTAISVFTVPIKDYFFNLVTINASGVLRSELSKNELFGAGLVKIFLYPIYIFIEGNWSILRYILLLISSIFLISTFRLIRQKNKIWSILIVILALGLANLRFVLPGTTYYEAFHMIPWYGLSIFSTFLILSENMKTLKRTFIYLLTLIVYLYILVSQGSYLHDKADPHFDLLTGYGNFMHIGQIVKILAEPDQSFFVDGFDELMHWSSDRPSSYRYSWYTSYMPQVNKYSEARQEMFRTNPPDFYYGSCPGEALASRFIPSIRVNDYQQLYSEGKPTCLYVRKDLISKIPKYKWDEARKYSYELPSE